jgi:hypothetical protein
MGTTEDTLSVVRAYYRGWTSKNFDEAVRLLAPDLKVEVPINDYQQLSHSPKLWLASAGS